MSCRTLSRAEFSGLGEEEALSLRLLIQAQGLLTASKTAGPSQSAAQQQWQAFAGLQESLGAGSDRPHGSALQYQQCNQMLYERLQHASAAAGWRIPMPIDSTPPVETSTLAKMRQQ